MDRSSLYVFGIRKLILKNYIEKVFILSPENNSGIGSFTKALSEEFTKLGYETIIASNILECFVLYLRYWKKCIFITSLHYGIFGFLKNSVFVLHGYPRFNVNGYYKYITVKIGHKISSLVNKKTVAVSRLVKLVNEHYFGINSDGVIYNPIRKIFKNESTEPKHKLIVYSGRIEKEKNIIPIIRAFINTKLASKGFELVIIGDGSRKSEYERKYSCASILFTGYLEEAELLYYLKKSRIFITLSDMEPYGISIAEALMQKNFLIFSDTTGAKEEIPAEYFSALIDPENINEITRALLRHAETLIGELPLTIKQKNSAAEYLKLLEK